MVTLPNEEQERIWAEVREEFPHDDTLQQVHFVRLCHSREVRGMTPQQRIEFFGRVPAGLQAAGR